jgi:hypothetical protein
MLRRLLLLALLSVDSAGMVVLLVVLHPLVLLGLAMGLLCFGEVSEVS